MLLTLTCTDRPATDLGFVLHKHPGRAQAFTLASGTAHVFYPEATDERCTAALLLDVDPIALARRPHAQRSSMGHYVNDRPYAASSLLAVALSRVFRTAMTGRCDARPELAGRALPLSVRIPTLPCRGGPELLSRLFEPLGWRVTATPVPLDPMLPAWGDSRHLDVRLDGELRVSDALRHVYVLLPVLDDAKHYRVGTDEVDKLLRAGEGWLAGHQERDLIMWRYLRHRHALVRSAVDQLTELDDVDAPGVEPVDDTDPDARPRPLAELRKAAVLTSLKAANARRVVDLGCGSGALLRRLLADVWFTEIVGADVSHAALTAAERRLGLARLADRVRERLTLVQSSVTYRDDRLAGYDAIVLMEVVEHVDPPRLPALERAVFRHARPATVVVTTPNAEHNVRYDGLAPGAFRHADHRFEWTRAEFGAWAAGVADAHGYTVRVEPVGEDDPHVGAPTQLAVFTRREPDADAEAVSA